MILERQAVRASRHGARNTAKAECRAWLKRRRDTGLKKRHAAKLARGTTPEMLL